MLKVKTVHKGLSYCFAMGEQVCAIGYALGEFAFIHAHLVLIFGSGFMLATGTFLCVVKLIDRKGPDNE